MSDKKSLRWIKAAKGIRYREHETRKHGKRFDKYYTLIYRHAGKLTEEAVGWASDGVTQAGCERLLAMLRENWRIGSGPQSLAEMREDGARQKTAELAAQEAEKTRLVTVAEYFKEHFLPYAKRTKKPQSWEKEDSHFRIWINPAMGHLPVVEIGFPQWDGLMRAMDKAGLSPRTKEYVCGTLRRILRHAQNRGMEIKIPSAKQIGATAPKDNRRLRVLTPAECETILSELEHRDIHAWRMTKFAMLTGCRASEAFNLYWREVDLDAGTVRFVDTKNHEERTIFLPPALIKHLKSFGPGEPGAVVFPRQDGKAYVEAPSAFRTVVRELGLNDNRAMRDRVTFHTIRHTTATNLAKSLDVRSLMDVMGWKVIAMAARYIHSNDDTKRAAMSTLEGTLAPQDKAKIIPFARGGGIG
jgi:integrase